MPISVKDNKMTYGPCRLLDTHVYWARREAHAFSKLTGMNERIYHKKDISSTSACQSELTITLGIICWWNR